jgi:hypothetical protein
MAINLFGDQIYDASSFTYDLDGGLFKPTGVQGSTLELGAEAEYFYAHGHRGPKGQTNTKFAPAGTWSQLADDFNSMFQYLWGAGGSLFMGGVTEQVTSMTVHLNGQRSLEIKLGGLRFYPQQLFDAGEAGSVTPVKVNCNVKFNSIRMNGIPFWQDPHAPNLG